MTDQDHPPVLPKAPARLGAARQQTILSLISRGDILAVGDRADRFGVSQETIRRDIRTLEEGGHLRRVHGGAAPAGPVDLTARRPVAERLEVEREAKTAAAEAALSLFEDGMNVFLGGSSTMLVLADALARSGLALSVTTNMIDIATTLAAAGRCKVTLLGGVLKATTHTLVGADMIDAIDQRVFDLAVCGASAIDPVHGCLGPSDWHAAIGAALARRSRRLAFVVDASKFDRSDAHVVLPLGRVHTIATDRLPPEPMVDALRQGGVALLLPRSAASAGMTAGKAEAP